MPEKIKKKEFISLLTNKMKVNDKTAALWVDAFTDTLYECFKN